MKYKKHYSHSISEVLHDNHECQNHDVFNEKYIINVPRLQKCKYETHMHIQTIKYEVWITVQVS